jgi:molybdate transport system permease protein
VILGKNGVLGSLIYRIFGQTILFTWYAAVIASGVAAFPLFVKTAQAAFSSVDDEYIYVSYTLGRGKLYTFFKIVLPLSKPGIIAGSILAFARAFGEFGATLVIAGNIPMKTTTIPIEIYNAVSSAQFQKANILVIITALISCGVLLVVNRLVGRWSMWR